LATSKSNRSANVQEKTLEEARESCTEAIALILVSNPQLAEQQLSDKEVIREKITVQISVKRRKLIRYERK
jgi:predicted RNase H-like HicB family nuclease